jgi:hypothetical protein
MLSGGNPVSGGNPAGVGTLNFIGKHAYAYSGPVLDSASASANTTVLEFSMPNNTYVVATIDWISSLSGNSARYINILQNGESIFDGRYDDVSPSNTNSINILLEPASNYEIKWGSSSSETVTIALVGEVF